MYYTNEPEYLVWLPMTKVQAKCMCLLYSLQAAFNGVVGSIYNIISCRLQYADWTLWLILLQSSSLVC